VKELLDGVQRRDKLTVSSKFVQNVADDDLEITMLNILERLRSFMYAYNMLHLKPFVFIRQLNSAAKHLAKYATA